MAVNAQDDLEALFDQISDQRMAELRAEAAPVPAPPAAPAPAAAEAVVAPSPDIADIPAPVAAMRCNTCWSMLPSLVATPAPAGSTAFSPVSPEAAVVAAAMVASTAASINTDAVKPDARELYQRVGGLTRQLHDALRELGYDKKVENAVNSLPDARARLGYIAKMTEQAAERALNAVDKGQEELSSVQTANAKLLTGWNKLFDKQLTLDEFKQLAHDTHAHLKMAGQRIGEANSHFTEIMMAQDFQDLTGQVIQKIGAVSQNLEEQLIQLLVDSAPAERRAEVHSEWMNGPMVHVEGRSDIVTDQAQVDDLLDSLGF